MSATKDLKVHLTYDRMVAEMAPAVRDLIKEARKEERSRIIADLRKHAYEADSFREGKALERYANELEGRDR